MMPTPQDEYIDLAAGIQAMVAASELFRRHGFDPVKVCGLLNDGDNMRRVIGRALWDDDGEGEGDGVD